MIVERATILDLTKDPANVRLHSEKNLSAIKGSLQHFGQQKPIVVDGSGVVIAGNGTLQAALALGWTEIDIVRTALTGAEAVAFALADNRTAELAEWNTDELGVTLKALFEGGFDTSVTGFEIGDFMASFDNDLDGDGEGNKKQKYILELEFPDQGALKDQYEVLKSQGLIVRIQSG